MWVLVCVCAGILICAYGVSWIAGKYDEWKHSDKYRRKQVCNFDNSLTAYDFERIIKHELKHIKRLEHYEIRGVLVFVYIYSQSGASIWRCCLDFNDFGHVSGEYWVYSENLSSSIPVVLGDRIKRDIELCKNGELNIAETEKQPIPEKKIKKYCPYCGQRLELRQRNFCEYCGGALN